MIRFSLGAVLVLLVVIVVVVMAVFSMVAGGRRSDRPRAGRTSLTCPHCGAETRADLSNCEHCEKKLLMKARGLSWLSTSRP